MSKHRIAAAIVFAIIVSLSPAKLAAATWLNLTDGTYDVTLHCTFSSFSYCPEDFVGTMTISGNGVSFMDFFITTDFFSGDPVDDIVHNPPTSVYESSVIVNSPLAYLHLNFDTVGVTDPSLGTQWWNECANLGDGTQNWCDPDTVGYWRATRVGASVPEPSTLMLLGAGLAGLRWRRQQATFA